jgi:hypothetical protein
MTDHPIDDIQDMEFAPKKRQIWLLRSFEEEGMLGYWRTSREKIQGLKGWHPYSFWASTLTGRKIDFEPVGWRESLSGVALEHAYAEEQRIS